MDDIRLSETTCLNIPDKNANDSHRSSDGEVNTHVSRHTPKAVSSLLSILSYYPHLYLHVIQYSQWDGMTYRFVFPFSEPCMNFI
jgi:hypothetical protein